MLARLGRFAVRRHRPVLAGTLLFLVLAGAFGGNVASRLSNGGFQDPSMESRRAAAILDREFNAGNPNLILLVTAKGGSVDDPATAARGAAITGELASSEGVAQAFSYWTLGSPAPLRSRDGRQALVLARLSGDEDELRAMAEELSPRFTRDDDLVSARVGGQAEIFRQVGEQIEHDLRLAEAITLPVVLVLLIVVFGSAVAAGLPLGVGAIAVVGTFLVLRILTSFTDVSIFSLNLATAMGLGLGIDYSLFIVSRFREEMRRGLDAGAAVVRTLETAGRTIAFSALTVAVSLAALLVFPLPFLHSFAYAGVAVVAIAAAGAIVSLPALLAALGPRVDRLTLWRRHPKEVGEGFWHRMATFVMRRPLPIAIGAIALLAILGAPFLGVTFGLPDDRALPKGASSRGVQDAIRADFSSEEAAALAIVAPSLGDPSARSTDIDAYAAAASALPGVARVDAVTGFYVAGVRVAPPAPLSARFASADGTWLSVVPSVEPMSPQGEALVESLRDLPAPFPVRIGGPSAELVDAKAQLFSRMPLAALTIALVTFVVLFLMTGSVLVPVKATALNLLSLSATFGAMVWVFQEGHLAGLLGFTPTGTLDTTTPILMFCVAFGLSMDYEVFLLSRIKEEHDLTGDNVRSVAVGLERTGRIVTAAAALLAVVFIAFATSKITLIKLMGVGMTLAVLLDATIIRATLVPAFMRLAGNANWWAPRPLRRLYERFGLHEDAPPAQPEPLPAPAEARG